MGEILATGTHELCGSITAQPDIYQKWMGFVAQHLYTYVPVSLTTHPRFEVQGRARTVEGFTMARFATSAGKCRLQRTNANIASDGRDGYALYVPIRGEMGISQFGREQLVGVGGYGVISAGALANHAKSGDNDTLCFVLPRSFVEERVVHGEDICARPCAMGTGLHNLLIETLHALQKNVWLMTDDELRASLRCIADLALCALRGSADIMPQAAWSVRTTNLARAKRIIRAKMSDPDLKLATIARETGLSLRYLHDLFRDEGRTMWEFLKNERLQRAREILERSSPRSVTVTDVSLECGFTNMSYFSSSFKRAFGVSPRDVLASH